LSNEKNQNTNQNSAFENLKTLSNYLSGGDLNNFVSSLNKTKKSIEQLVKVFKDKESKIQATIIEEERKAEELKKQQEILEQQKLAEQREKENAITMQEIIEASDNKAKSNSSQQSQKFVKNNNQVERTINNYQNRNDNNFSRPNNQFNRNNNNNQNNQQQNNKPGFKKDFKKDGNNNPNFKKPATDKPFDKKPAATGEKKPYVKPSGLLGKSNSAIDIVVAKPDRTFGNKNKTKVNENEKKELNKKAMIRKGYIAIDDFENEDRIGRVRTKPKKQKVESKPIEKVVIDHCVITTENLTVKMLSEKIGKPAVDIIKKFFMLGMMPNINSIIDFPTAELVAQEFGVTLELKLDKNYEEQLTEIFENQSNSTDKRHPIVTVMGHVDHGKTSLLDAIRNTNVISSEAGGITQHIGAYEVDYKGDKITFIDTPGHAAFTSMRARGAKITDVAILVVAADDGIMPQTVEAINHIKAAGVPMLVAINKIDKPEANIDRIKQQLTEHDVLCEEWGGDTICVPISAKKNMNIDKLLEMVLLVSEMADLTADKSVKASGYILESKIDKGRGIVATVIVKNGTLKVGDFLVCGICSGRVRAMMDHKGKNVVKAEPSTPVSILGFNNVPEAGDMVYVVDEKMAKNIIDERTAKLQIEKSKQNTSITLEDFLQKSADMELKTLNIIVKADVKGTTEAIKQTLEKIENEEVKVACIHNSVGGINESDVLLAQASNAVIIGFNVRPEAKAKALAEKNGVDIKLYRVIYDAVDDIKLAINGMLAPKFEEEVTGHAEIRQTFKISAIGTIAGCYVQDGVINRGSKIRLLRSNIVIHETVIETLQQQKDEAKSIKAGYECGIKLKNYNDIKVGDVIEAYEIKQI